MSISTWVEENLAVTRVTKQKREKGKSFFFSFYRCSLRDNRKKESRREESEGKRRQETHEERLRVQFGGSREESQEKPHVPLNFVCSRRFSTERAHQTKTEGSKEKERKERRRAK